MINSLKIILFIILFISIVTYGQELSSDNSWIDMNKTYLKIGVAADGIYRINYSDLINNGINPASIIPQNLILYKSGIKIPIFVEGKNDGNFDENDFIEFVGTRNMGGKHREINLYNEPYNEYLGRYTDTTIYWLTWDNIESSVIDYSDALPNIIPVSSIDYFYETVHYERNIALDYSIGDLVRKEMPYWTENKTWIESLLNVGTKSYQINADNIYPDKPAYIFAKLQDYASNVSSNNHIAAIGINNSLMYDTTLVERYQQALLNSEINSNLLTNGTNSLKIQSLSTGASINVLAMDWVELEYPKYLIADDDSLQFTFPYLVGRNIYRITIENINSNDISFWKYNDGYKKYLAELDNGTTSIIDTMSSSSKFIICRTDQIQKPIIYYSKNFSSFKNPELSYDYILITHKTFKSKANLYSQFISEHYGKRVIVVDIDDIYDEYSFGFFNPEAIKSFIKSAYENWANPKPEYLFLVGGATFDYHGNKHKYGGSPKVYNYVPSFGVPVSDNWFVMWDETNPTKLFMNIGRLPVKTNEEFDWYFTKHKELTENKFDAWNKRFLFFSGGTGNNQSQIDALRNINQKIIDSLIVTDPIGGVYTHFYKTLEPVSNFGPYTQGQIQRAIDSGGVFISYIGHSGTQTWDNSITDVNQLKNAINRYPLITDFGCSTARFAEPDVTSFSQLFVNSPDGQAIGYIGNTSLGFTSTSYSFPELFFNTLIKDSVRSIGNAHRLAKEKMIDKYGLGSIYQLFNLTNTLIGDPIVQLPLPEKTNLHISNESVKYFQNSFADSEDSIKIKLVYNNFGLTGNSKFSINIQRNYLNELETSNINDIEIPQFADSLIFTLSIKEKPGKHSFTVKLDQNNIIDEINEDDNLISFDVNVASSNIKLLTAYKNEGQLINPVVLLSPSKNPETNLMIVETADNPEFFSSINQSITIDTVLTKYNLSEQFKNKRVWMRTKLENSDEYSQTTSFIFGDKISYILSDSVSYAESEMENLIIADDSVYTEKDSLQLTVLSAGFHDGNTALIQVNGQNYIPENTLRGHHVAVFDESNLNFVSYQRFDTYSGGEVHNNYIQFLDTLSSKFIIAVAVSDEGRITNSTLRTKLKEYGSIYIDQLVFRGSWAFIGKKGSTPGTYDEAVSNPFQGRVHADYVMNQTHSNVRLKTSVIGSAKKWNELKIESDFENSINIIPIGIRQNNQIDTLTSLNNLNSDISNIDPNIYPKIQFIVEGDNISVNAPFINSIEVEYEQSPEIVLNYQSVDVDKDTLAQGEELTLTIKLYNTGYTTAEDVDLSINLTTADAVIKNLFVVSFDSISPFSFKSSEFKYKAINVSGNIKFEISADAGNKIHEYFKDNNYYEVPVFVKINEDVPLLNVKYDEIDIFDGDYISADPNIKIELSDESILPVNDTSAVSIYLDGIRLNYFNNSTLSYNFSETNPKILIDFNPHLSDGDHELKVTAKNIYNNDIDNVDYVKTFKVSSKSELLNVYNYPNPFSDETYFTFKLTQIPDELRIKIFTLAGRLLREITKIESELNYDFNRIYWDGRDEDGDLIANGVYLYKVILKKGSEIKTATQKLAIMR